MNSTSNDTAPVAVWKETPLIWLYLGIISALLAATFFEAFRELVRIWNLKEEYSYGYIIPLISVFLVWQRKDQLERTAFTGSWLGVGVVALGVCVFAIGNLATLFLVVQYSFLIILAGLVLAFVGTAAFRLLAVPLLLLAFMIPLPEFFLQEISARLQLVSSEIGVAVIRLFGISVFLEGNVIDLGSYKLQVVEACNGLRYLFPLMTLAFIAAYFYQAEFWKRAVLFLSSIPITVLMNSFRIGVIGVLVEYWGPSMAEGFLHDFEGWAVFMACTAVLIAEIWILNRIGGQKRAMRDVFGIELPAPTPPDATVRPRSLPTSLLAAGGVVMMATIIAFALPTRSEISPSRASFDRFPLELEEWKGSTDRIERIYLDALRLDDYILVNYAHADHNPVNFYVAYYSTQRKGQSAHSPRTCIPGGGWRITQLDRRQVTDVQYLERPLVVNRTVIQKGEFRQLVYYWFQQRGRNLTNEYLVKWFIFWDALTMNRTDGALVRLTTMVRPDEDLSDADRRLVKFAGSALPHLPRFIPD
jgi:exosortase D (VPLPA-CTERM-specific)